MSVLYIFSYKMARREILNIDTNPAHYNTGQGYQTYQFDSTKVALAPNSFNIRVPLQKTNYGIRKINLKSIELPVNFTSVRATSNLNTIVIADSTNVYLYTIILADKNYTNIATLITDLNAMALSTFPTINMFFSLNSSGFVQISSTC